MWAGVEVGVQEGFHGGAEVAGAVPRSLAPQRRRALLLGYNPYLTDNADPLWNP